MNFLEKAKALTTDPDVQKGSSDFLDDTISALLGNPISAGKIMVSLAKCPFFFREKLFWIKFEHFLSGVDVSDNERAEFCARLTEEGANNDNPYRLLQAIEHAETHKKIDYLINASRSLAAGFIELPDYFRICSIITGTIEEDLVFLANHIQNNADFEYSSIIQGLLNVGLAYRSVIDGNGDNRYRFTPLANLVDKFAISYNNLERYPMVGVSSSVCEPSMKQEISDLQWGDF